MEMEVRQTSASMYYCQRKPKSEKQERGQTVSPTAWEGTTELIDLLSC